MTRPAARSRFFLLTSLLTTLVLSAEVKAQTVQPAASSVVSVTVQRGDTAYSIARRSGLSVDLLLSYNNMTSPDLAVGQVLYLRPPTHTVQPGDTVYGLSRQYGVPVDAILAANTMPRSVKLEVGQLVKLPVGAASVAPAAAPAPAAAASAPLTRSALSPQTFSAPPQVTSSSWYSNAMSLLGTPYVLGGTSRKGIDCSGFVLQVMSPLGVRLPRRSVDQARAGLPVDEADLRPGDLLFFDTVGGGEVTHVGIYLGNDSFINANSYYGKVVVDKFRSDSYWSPRFMGARRVMMDAMASN